MKTEIEIIDKIQEINEDIDIVIKAGDRKGLIILHAKRDLLLWVLKG